MEIVIAFILREGSDSGECEREDCYERSNHVIKNRPLKKIVEHLAKNIVGILYNTIFV